MLKLLWAERQKLRRSSIALLTIFATVLAAIVVFIGGNSMDLEGQYIDSAGWYMTMVQPWATLLVIPAVIALLGSYIVCREEQDDTIKTLRLIPVNRRIFSCFSYHCISNIYKEKLLVSTNLNRNVLFCRNVYEYVRRFKSFLSYYGGNGCCGLL